MKGDYRKILIDKENEKIIANTGRVIDLIDLEIEGEDKVERSLNIKDLENPADRSMFYISRSKELYIISKELTFHRYDKNFNKIENKLLAANGVFKGIATSRDENVAVVAFAAPPRFIVLNLVERLIEAKVEIKTNITQIFMVDEEGVDKFIVVSLADKSIQIYSMS